MQGHGIRHVVPPLLLPCLTVRDLACAGKTTYAVLSRAHPSQPTFPPDAVFGAQLREVFRREFPTASHPPAAFCTENSEYSFPSWLVVTISIPYFSHTVKQFS